jgi:hypothetical protein
MDFSEAPVVAESVEQVATDCRTALRLVLAADARSWSKADLAAWLTGPYAEATRHTRKSLPRISSWGIAARSTGATVTPIDLRRVIASASEAVFPALREAARGCGEFATEALANGQVVLVRDERRKYGFAPVDLGPMRLETRILSLLAADFLSNPEEYEEQMFVCEECGALAFDAERRHLRQCEDHAPHSGIHVRDLGEEVEPVRRTTLIGIHAAK